MLVKYSNVFPTKFYLQTCLKSIQNILEITKQQVDNLFVLAYLFTFHIIYSSFIFLRFPVFRTFLHTHMHFGCTVYLHCFSNKADVATTRAGSFSVNSPRQQKQRLATAAASARLMYQKARARAKHERMTKNS